MPAGAFRRGGYPSPQPVCWWRWCVPWSAWILLSASRPVLGDPPPLRALQVWLPFVFSSPWNSFAARSLFGSRAALPRPSLVTNSPGIAPGRRSGHRYRARYASSREPAIEIDYFFTSSVNALDCSSPLSFSPTICRSPYSATSSPLGTLSDRSVCRRRTLYRATSRSVNSALLWTRWTSLTPNATYVQGWPFTGSSERSLNVDVISSS